MKHETFIRAKDIYDQMDYLNCLIDLFENAGSETHPHLLAAISSPKFEDARNIVIKECKVDQHIKLQDDIKGKIIKLISDEYYKLQEEFKAL